MKVNVALIRPHGHSFRQIRPKCNEDECILHYVFSNAPPSLPPPSYLIPQSRPFRTLLLHPRSFRETQYCQADFLIVVPHLRCSSRFSAISLAKPERQPQTQDTRTGLVYPGKQELTTLASQYSTKAAKMLKMMYAHMIPKFLHLGRSVLVLVLYNPGPDLPFY